MLVLTRKRSESVLLIDADGQVIGSVEVIEVRGGAIRLGFNFPKSITVSRSEVAKLQDVKSTVVKTIGESAELEPVAA